MFYDVHKENMFTINLEDGREAPSKASVLNFFFNNYNFSFRTAQRGFTDSPGRRSIDEIGREIGNRRPIDEPMFVSDGRTIRSGKLQQKH